MFRKFLRKNLQASGGGTEEQQIDMASLVAETSNHLSELGDLMGGKRKKENHPHHEPGDLASASIGAVIEITKLRREIEG